MMSFSTDVKMSQRHVGRVAPATDRAVWAFRRMAISFFVPLKSHSMHIYRRKL